MTILRFSLKKRSFALGLMFLLLFMLIAFPAFAQNKAEDDGDKDTKESDAKSEDAENPDEDEEADDDTASPADDKEEQTEPGEDKKKERTFPKLGDQERTVAIDFTDTDIKQIVKIMSEMTGENFMVDKGVSGTVTIISPTKVTPREAYDIFMSILAVNGFTTVRVGKITKIIPIKDAQTSPVTTRTSGIPRASDEFITQLVPLKHIDANDAITAFRSFVSPNGNMFAYGPSNMVIILDSSVNVKRLMKILMQLDVSGGKQEVVVVPLEYASAEQLADVILELFEEASSTQTSARRTIQSRLRSRTKRSRSRSSRFTPGSTSVPSKDETKILADTRTNSLIVKASKVGLAQILDLIRKLDQPLPGGEGKIHVVFLENAEAEELAQTLADLAGTGGGVGAARGMTNTRNQSRLNSSRSSNMARSRIGGLGQQQQSTQRLGQTQGRFLADFDGAVRITAEPATNSLVIIASNRDFKILKEVIDKLDIPRRQVFVEALIMEISTERGLDLGFEFRSTNDMGEDGVQVLGGSNYGGIQQAAANPLGISGFAIGAADGTITYAGETFPNIGALFTAMATDQDVNVLSTPHVMTLDNEEAEVVVADNVPFVTGQIYSTNNTNPTTTIERKDVGITLRLTPQINESNFVKLMIYQEVSQVTDSPEGLSASSVGVTTAKRTADTVVVVKDRQTVIIGGLLKDSNTLVESKVPILGDIPLLGYLFKSSKAKTSKTNLLIFLTPYIIKDSADIEEVTRLTNKRMENFRERNHIPETFDRLDPERVTPHEGVFRAPMGESIETDPRLRRQMEGEGASGDEAGDAADDETYTEEEVREDQADDDGAMSESESDDLEPMD